MLSRARQKIPTAEIFEPLLEPSRYKGAYGGRGSGKSHFFAELGVEHCCMYPGTRWLCGREVQKSLKESAKLLIEDKIKAHNLTSLFDIQSDKIRTLGDGIIVFQGLQEHTVDTIKSYEGYDLFWCEEANKLSQRSLDLVRPTFRKPGSELWFSWNPLRKSDPVDSLLRGPNASELGATVIRANWSENPWFPLVLEKERAFDLKHSPETYEHVWEGAYATVVKGAYYAADIAQAMREGRIGRVARDPLQTIRVFCDLGGASGTADAFSMWVTQFLGREIRVLDYYESVGQAAAAHMAWLREGGYDKAHIWLPHDGTASHGPSDTTWEGAFKVAGFKNVTVVKNQGKGAARQRIEAGRRRFPMMWFNAATTAAGREALGSYHEKRDEDRQIGLGPSHDWCLAAGTKILTTIGWQSVENINVHDKVLTPCGARSVLRAGIVREACEWLTVNGVRCTPEHRFFTSRGLVQAGELSDQDSLWTQESWGLRILAFLSVTLHLGLKGAITSATPKVAAGIVPCSFTVWCMRLFMERFRTVTRSITSMTTHLTITQAILKPFPALSIAAATSRSPDTFAFAEFVDTSLAAISGSAPDAAQSVSAPIMHKRSESAAEPAYNITVDVDECYFVLGDDGNSYLVSNSSHAADAFGLMCIAYEGPKPAKIEKGPFAAQSDQQEGAWLGS